MKQENKSRSYGDITVLIVLSLTGFLITLKLYGIVHLYWYWVFAPIFVYVGFLFLLVCALRLLQYLERRHRRRQHKKIMRKLEALQKSVNEVKGLTDIVNMIDKK